MKSEFIFVIDTEDYAGNFERELCAYCTGCVGDCGVGEDSAKVFEEETNIKDSWAYFDIFSKPDDEGGCCRPTSIYSTTGSSENNSVAIYFFTRPTKEQIELIKSRAEKYNEYVKTLEYRDPIKIIGFRLIEEITTQKITQL